MKAGEVMDVNGVIQLISNLGFPIVCCGALFWKMNKQDMLHKNEIDNLSNVIQNNTNVLERYIGVVESEK